MSPPLRVALVSDYYYPDLGGMPEHVHHLAVELSRRGHAITVITTAFPEAPPLRPSAATSFEVVRIGRASGALITNGSVARAAVGWNLHGELSALFSRRGFDVIHVHAPIFPTLALLAIRCAPEASRLVGTLHSHFSESRLLRLLRGPLQRYLDALDGLIAVSDSALDSMRRVGFRCDAAIIPNGVAISDWKSGRRLPAFDDGCQNLLLQARLEPRNHVGTVLSALRRLSPELRAAARLIVVGDGPERTRLLQESAGLRVSFVGPQLSQRPDFAATSDVYCFTAAIASHPISLLEGMAAGLPVLAHDIDGVRELVTDGHEGFVLPLSDPAAYATALSRLLADARLRAAMGRAAALRAAAFSWQRVAGAVENFYREVIAATSRARSEPYSAQ
jgi:phosphatidylinositol alpha-mannosyltransferase